MASADRAHDVSGAGRVSSVLAYGAPLAVVGLAATLWLISDQLVSVGPIDRATFGWAVVVPLWSAAPVAAGFAWQRLSSEARRRAAVACGLVVGAPVSILAWQAAAFPACSPARTR